MKEHTTRRKFLRTATGCGAIAGLTALSNPGHATPVQSLSQTTGEPTVLLQQPLENPAGFAIHEGDFFIGAGENLLRVSVADGILWTESTASPVVDVTAIDGCILLGTDDGVEAFSPAGNQEWTRPLDGVNQLIRIGQGICVFSGDRTLAYISPDGTQQWETTVSGAEANISALISGSDDATIYAAVLERMSPRIIDENVNIDLFAINSDSGSIEFQETVVTESAHTDDLVELSEFNGEIYLAHEQNDVGLDQNARKMLYKYKDGLELWQTEARETYDFWSEGSNNYRIQTQPAANGDALYSQGPGDAIASFNTSDGTNQWTGAIIPRSIHATTEGVVFAGVDAGEPRLRRLQKMGCSTGM